MCGWGGNVHRVVRLPCSLPPVMVYIVERVGWRSHSIMCFSHGNLFGPSDSHSASCFSPVDQHWANGKFSDDHVCECASCKCLVFTLNKICVNCRKGNHA
ncbi:uncharacterized protein L203_101662 [Cryptococcus depauperatus CBS 7841]|uniref:Uncharacterized protein n=1 Tax=Cryptococcus depauperatus CBS 7841 TaxID=1295531 RepID=A0AAJ8JQE2_9TREE